jgi:cytochrome c2
LNLIFKSQEKMKKKLIFTALTLLLTLYVFSIPPVDDGKVIFASRCASCHNVNKTLVGPALAGVSERRSEDWIIHFVRSSQKVIKGGDKTALALYEKFNKVAMPDHADLSPDNIKGILAYVKSETKNTPVEIAFRPEKIHPSYTPIAITNYRFFVSFISLVVLLAASFLTLVKVKEMRRRNEDVQTNVLASDQTGNIQP